MKWLQSISDYFYPEPEVVTCKPKVIKDISEPVITFAELLKNNPERFSFKWRQRRSYYDKYHTYCILKDKALNEVFTISIVDEHRSTHNGNYITSTVYRVEECKFLTDDEIRYLEEALKICSKARETIKKEKLKIRANRARQKFIDIYCKEGE